MLSDDWIAGSLAVVRRTPAFASRRMAAGRALAFANHAAGNGRLLVRIVRNHEIDAAIVDGADCLACVPSVWGIYRRRIRSACLRDRT